MIAAAAVIVATTTASTTNDGNNNNNNLFSVVYNIMKPIERVMMLHILMNP